MITFTLQKWAWHTLGCSSKYIPQSPRYGKFLSSPVAESCGDRVQSVVTNYNHCHKHILLTSVSIFSSEICLIHERGSTKTWLSLERSQPLTAPNCPVARREARLHVRGEETVSLVYVVEWCGVGERWLSDSKTDRQTGRHTHRQAGTPIDKRLAYVSKVISLEGEGETRWWCPWLSHPLL